MITFKKLIKFILNSIKLIVTDIRAKPYVAETVEDFDLSYYKNKTIAIVGPASTALLEKKGDYIDSFDIVVRINRSINNYLEKTEYLGSKTDILFHGLNESAIGGCGPVQPLQWIEKGVKKVVFPLFGNEHKGIINKYIIRSKGKLKLSCINAATYNEMKNSLDGFRPTTGFASIYLMSKAEYKKLYITGFTFYKTPYQSDYKAVNIETERKNIQQENYHSFEIEYNCFKNIFNNSTNIIIDEGMKEIM